jgi:hypothetical protein
MQKIKVIRLSQVWWAVSMGYDTRLPGKGIPMTTIRRGPPEVTLQDVSEDVERIARKLDQALSDLDAIKETLEKLVSSTNEIQKSVDERD